MTEDADLGNLPEAVAVAKKRARLSLVWIVPIVAALVGLGIVIQRYLAEGPTITISFRTAEGIVPGKTFLKYKDVEIGKVTTVAFSGDYSRILVSAKMAGHAEGLLVEDSRFWIVKPRISLSGVSGIGTLISGNYIGIEPGKSPKRRNDFVGLEAPPPVAGGRPGREFVLRAETLGSLGIGSPVYYRRLNAGQVIGSDLTADGKSVEVTIFVDAPYDALVTPDTRFWESSGVRASMGPGGLSLETESLISMLIGGIVFERSPYAGADNTPAAAKSVFTLFNSRETALAPQEAEVERFVLYFTEPLEGLSPGAPVNLLGLPVGEVTELGLDYDPKKGLLRTRVELRTFDYRFLRYLGESGVAAARTMSRAERREFLQNLVETRSMRAQLRPGSFLSGQMVVAVDYFPDAPKARIDWSQDPPVFPVVPGKMVGLETRIREVLAKLERVPMDEIGQDLRKAIAALDGTLQSANRTLARFDAETLPEVKKTLEDLRRGLHTAERLLGNADNTLLGPDSPAPQELRDALREIARAARAIRELADSLERNPEALLRGKRRGNP